MTRPLLVVATALVLVCGGAAVAGCVILGLGAQLVAQRPAAPVASPDDLQFTARPPENSWPDRVTFRARGAGPAAIARVTLWYNFGPDTEYRPIAAADFRPGRSFDSAFVLQTSGNAYLPPGTELRYHFQVNTEDGDEVNTPEQSFLYLDTRYKWSSVSRDNVTVLYHGGAQNAAGQVLAAALRSVQNVGGLLGLANVRPMRVVLYASRDEMDPAIPPDLRTTGTDFVTEGLTYQEQRVILVNPGVSDLLSNVAHEAAHMISNEVAGPAYGRMPFWLSEGISVYAQPDNGATYTPFVLRAIQTRSLLRLSEMVGVPDGGPQRILTGYGQSALFVRFLIERYGGDKLAKLVAAYRASDDHERNLREIYGKGLADLEAEWLGALDHGEVKGYPPRPPG
jgi:hypothetical protein